MGSHKLAVSVLALLVLASPFLFPGATATPFLMRRFTQVKPPDSPPARSEKMAKNEAGVLRELKETIRKQASEIESLKKQLSSTRGSRPKAGGGGHGGHGAGVADSSPDELAAYLHLPFYKIATTRVGWLGLFLVSLSMTALIMSGFEDTLEQQLELAYFVPLLAGHGGNTGGQAVGTVLSAFSAGVVTVKDARTVIPKEALSGKCR